MRGYEAIIKIAEAYFGKEYMNTLQGHYNVYHDESTLLNTLCSNLKLEKNRMKRLVSENKKINEAIHTQLDISGEYSYGKGVKKSNEKVILDELIDIKSRIVKIEKMHEMDAVVSSIFHGKK